MTMQRENLGPFDRVWEDAPAVAKPSAVLAKARKAYEDRAADKVNGPDEPVLTTVIEGVECGDQTYKAAGVYTATIRVNVSETVFEQVAMKKEPCRCGYYDKYSIHACKAPSVDPLWDRYFELAFQQATVMLGRSDTLFLDGSGKECTPSQWAAGAADKMLAERNKRLG